MVYNYYNNNKKKKLLIGDECCDIPQTTIWMNKRSYKTLL